jgi:hypothetical protein
MSNRIKKFDGGGEVGGAQNATVTLADGTVVTRGFLDWLAKNSASNYDSAAANIFGDYDFEGETEADIPVWQQMRDKLNALEGMTGTDAGDLYKELGGLVLHLILLPELRAASSPQWRCFSKHTRKLKQPIERKA